MLGLGTAGIVAGLGALLVCHGLYRVRLKKAENRHWLRSSGLMCQMLGLLAVLGFAIHAFVPLLNAFRIADFPLGYYMAAQGSLIAFVILLFFFAARANAIDVAEDAAED
jgi:putative solute:sodium symporter small subunit